MIGVTALPSYCALGIMSFRPFPCSRGVLQISPRFQLLPYGHGNARRFEFASVAFFCSPTGECRPVSPYLAFITRELWAELEQ